MSGFFDILSGLLTREPKNEAKPPTPMPRREEPVPAQQPAWSPVPVQADAPQTPTPEGWNVPGQPAPPIQVIGPPSQLQAPAPQTYAPPPGWTVPGQLQADQAQAQQAAVQQALAQRFGR